MDNLKIKNINAIEILDSRGTPTVQVKVELENGISAVAKVPSGASTGSFEAVELRDEDKKRYSGKGVLHAVNNVNTIINSNLKGMNVTCQEAIDEKLIKLDGTKNKSKLGANATLGVSLAVARAAAKAIHMPLYRYIGGLNALSLPVPMMNILNGGKHANNNVNIQEFMIVPTSADTFEECMQIGCEVYQSLKRLLKSKNLLSGIGDEGGFAPNLENDSQAIELIIEAIKNAGYVPGTDVSLALDVASTEMYFEAQKLGEEGKYYFWKTGELKTADEMINYLENLTNKYPIISIEDGLAEEDWESWEKLTQKLGNKILLVGDDLFVTNADRLRYGIEKNVANCILIKPNQIGTLTETLNTIEEAKQNGYGIIISHRSGETEDTFIADLAVGVNAKRIKSGAPARTDRVCKYNRLLNIEKEL